MIMAIVMCIVVAKMAMVMISVTLAAVTMVMIAMMTMAVVMTVAPETMLCTGYGDDEAEEDRCAAADDNCCRVVHATTVTV